MSDLLRQSRALSKRLRAIPRELLEAPEVRAALVQGAEEIADGARALVPVEDGALRASITVTGPGETTPAYSTAGSVVAEPNQALVTVGNPQVRHGHLQEFGAAQHEAQPFLRPAFRLKRQRVQNRIGRAIGRAVRRLGGGA